jgi:hypothetical protein
VIDIYRESTMTYAGSLRVSTHTSDIAALEDGTLAAIETDMVPVVRIWSIVRH